MAGVKVVSGDDPDLVIALDQDDGQQPFRRSLAVVNVARFTLNVLFIDEDRGA